MPDWDAAKGIEVPSATPTGAAGLRLKANFERLRNEAPYNATDDPDEDNDEGEGFFAGSLWLNTTAQVMWVCTDPAAGDAVWRQLYQRTSSALILCPGEDDGSLSGERALQLGSGGDPRGPNAVDFQTSRSADSQVASAYLSMIAGGKNNTAYGFSHAEGYGTIAGGHAEGKLTIASGGHAEGYYTTTSTGATHAEGRYTIASGECSHAQGYAESIASGGITASGRGSEAGGWANSFGNITASGYGSHASGYAYGSSGNIAYITASAAGSHAEGFSYGDETILASGKGAHAEGRKTTASEDYAHAEGWETTANAKAAHAEGRGTTASGFYSHAQGRSSTASGKYSHAAGHESTALFIAQYAVAGGKFDVTGDAQYTQFIMHGTSITNSFVTLSTPEKFDDLTNEKSYGCTITIHGRQDNGTHHAMYRRLVIIERTGGTVDLAGSPQTIGADIATDGTWAINIDKDDGSTVKGLKIEAHGGTSQTVKWVAIIEAIEIKYSD